MVLNMSDGLLVCQNRISTGVLVTIIMTLEKKRHKNSKCINQSLALTLIQIWYIVGMGLTKYFVLKFCIFIRPVLCNKQLRL